MTDRGHPTIVGCVSLHQLSGQSGSVRAFCVTFADRYHRQTPPIITDDFRPYASKSLPMEPTREVGSTGPPA